MLAEIFILRLESQLRAAREPNRVEIPQFVPLPIGTIANFQKNS
jgi:hypothetical protein